MFKVSNIISKPDNTAKMHIIIIVIIIDLLKLLVSWATFFVSEFKNSKLGIGIESDYGMLKKLLSNLTINF